MAERQSSSPAGGRYDGLAVTARTVHPGAWWLWAIGLAIAASRTTNPLLLGLIIAVAGYVVAARRPQAPWSRSFGVFLRIGLIVIAIRLLFQAIVSAPIGTTVIVTLPSITLPDLFAGVRFGGDITAESMLAAFYDGLRLATILACVGAANSLASPARLLKAAPAALYEFGVSLVIAVTFAPQLVADLDRIRAARRLRGRPNTGIRGAAGASLPVLEGALERSVDLAAAMDARGYGRQAERSPRLRRVTTGALIAGLVAIIIGVYALLDASAPGYLGVPLIIIGGLLGLVGFFLAGRRATRTRYRPDPWSGPEWLLTACAITTGSSLVVLGILGVPGLTLPVDPPAWPSLPPVAVLGILVSVLPAFLTPAQRPTHRAEVVVA